MEQEYRYILEKGSKKYHCPNCGKPKKFVRYLDVVSGEYLPDEYGACDRADKCAYHLNPYSEGYAKMIWKQENGEHSNWIPNKATYSLPKAKPISFVPPEVLQSTLSHYDKNVFIQNLLTNVVYPFDSKDIEAIISQYYLGTISEGYRVGAITFPFIDRKKNIRAIQTKNFDRDNHTIATDFIHSILKPKSGQIPDWIAKYEENDTKVSCLFGANLIDKYPLNPIALVEAPKSAVYGTLYFGSPNNPNNLLWLAVFNLSSLTLSRCKDLEGRDVYLFPDLSKNGTAFKSWSDKASKLQEQLPGTRFIVSDLLEVNALDTDRKVGMDIADFLIKHDWRDYRRSDKSDKGDTPKTLLILDKSEKHTKILSEAKQSQELIAPNVSSRVQEENDNMGSHVFAKKSEKNGVGTERSINSFENDTMTKYDATEEAQKLNKFFDDCILPSGAVELNPGVRVADLPTMLRTHFTFVESNPVSRSALPYLNRLNQLKLIISNIK